MSHDDRMARTRAFLAGVKWAVKAMADVTADGQQKALASFLARETFEDGETRRLVEGALRVER
jgi:hypothetical protein